jgi:hypothetical protein
MNTKIRTIIITLAAAVSIAVSAAPASAYFNIVTKGGSWGHYNCEIGEPGSGVYIQDGSSGTYKDANGNPHTVTCTNGKLDVTRVGISQPVHKASPLSNAPETGSPSPVTKPVVVTVARAGAAVG